MLDKPLVSVLMTAYNREKYIAEAIESVLSSTYTNWELIIVDDTSKDATVKIGREYEKKDFRIKVYLNDVNLGDYPNRNKAASYAKGKYLKFLDSDDTIKPWGLEYCVKQMEHYPEAGLGLILINPTNSKDAVLMPSVDIIREHFFNRAYLNIGPSGTIIRRDIFEANNGFDTRFRMASDSFFNLTLALKTPIVLLTKFFFHYRYHGEQESKNSNGYLIYNYLYSKEFFNKASLPLTGEELNYLKRKLQKRHSVNLLKFLLKTKSFRKVADIMEQTDYTLAILFKGLLK
jgi:glycosyltransferase involved in cell wall biosynthesis